jgi:biopolymer transport protein TolR
VSNVFSARNHQRNKKKGGNPMAITIGGRSGVSSEINITPMIDVLLTLLIIFMVLFPNSSMGDRAEIPRPSGDLTIAPPSKPIFVFLQAFDGPRPAIRINEEKVSWTDFGARLAKIYSVRVDKTAFLKSDPEVDFQYAAEAVDIAHHAGVERVGLMGKASQ